MTETTSYNDVATLLNNLTSNYMYNRHVRPKAKQDERTNITLGMWLKSITKFNDVDGVITSIFALTMEWKDDFFCIGTQVAMVI